MKRLKVIAIIFLVLIILFFAGPQPPKPELSSMLPCIDIPIEQLDEWIKQREDSFPVKPGNESEIVWANDSLKQKTEYCLLYLHGFSASGHEGYPTHINFAAHYDMNAYIPRLAPHGLDVPEPLLNMTPDKLYNSAKEAFQIAKILGEKIIIMSTSTGGTLSLKLAAEFPESIAGMLLLSPNIRINNPAAPLLSGPWGLQIARTFYKGKYRIIDDDECTYWNCKYRLEAIVYLQQLVAATMKSELYARVKTPVFLAYYYKDEQHQDLVVKVDAMLDMFDKLGTPHQLKVKQAFDAGRHVIGGEDSNCQPEVEQACILFASEILGISASADLQSVHFIKYKWHGLQIRASGLFGKVLIFNS